MYHEPDISQDDDDIVIDMFADDGQGMISIRVRRESVVVTKTRIGEPGEGKVIPHSAFKD